MVECPSADVLIASTVVKDAFQKAWNESFPSKDDCREQGGFIYAEIDADKKLIDPLNLNVTRAGEGKIVKQKDVKGENPEIDLNTPKVPSDTSKSWLLVANFHTHPLDKAVGGNEYPSKADFNNAYDRWVPSIVISRAGAIKYGVLEREYKTNPTGYPNTSGLTKPDIMSGKPTKPAWKAKKATNEATF